MGQLSERSFRIRDGGSDKDKETRGLKARRGLCRTRSSEIYLEARSALPDPKISGLQTDRVSYAPKKIWMILRLLHNHCHVDAICLRWLLRYQIQASPRDNKRETSYDST
jgi:hypothetical protein